MTHAIFRFLTAFIMAVALTAAAANSSAIAANTPSEDEVNIVLTSTESLFKAMQGKRFVVIWHLLTEKTKQSIVDAVYRELRKAGNPIERGKILKDFADGGQLAQSYWEAYLFVFNPEMVLEQSKWSVGEVRQNRVEINILFRKSEKPAVLQVYKESGEWKVGLNETFGTRNMMPF